MTSFTFRAPVCAGCEHEYIEHIGDPQDLDRVLERGFCTRPDCECAGWVWPAGIG